MNDEGTYATPLLTWMAQERSLNGVTKVKFVEESLLRIELCSCRNPYPMLEMEDKVMPLALLQLWIWPFHYV